MLILYATHRASGRTKLVGHEGSAAVVEEVARVGATNRAAPIEAVRAGSADRTTAEDVCAVTRHGQFER